MNKKFVIALILVIIGVLIGLLVGKRQTKEYVKDIEPTSIQSYSGTNCIADECLLGEVDFPIKKLPKEIEDTLLRGLDDEYKAYSTYQAAMEKYGNIRPFVMIARAEQHHIVALQGLFEKYGIQIPVNPYPGNILTSENMQSACATGVTAEIENVALYKEKLLPMVTQYPDITRVFTNLMNASEQKHLPAFMRCD